jgi:hypothetical protein
MLNNDVYNIISQRQIEEKEDEDKHRENLMNIDASYEEEERQYYLRYQNQGLSTETPPIYN